MCRRRKNPPKWVKLLIYECPLLAQSGHSAEYKNIQMPFYAIIISPFTLIKSMTLIPLDCKQLILEDAKERILKNHTLEQIAKIHGFKYLVNLSWRGISGVTQGLD
jgi:hypothetical protein